VSDSVVVGDDVVNSGTLEDTELVDGLVFNQKTAGSGGPKRIEKAKIGLIQFCISPPKTDVCLHYGYSYQGDHLSGKPC